MTNHIGDLKPDPTNPRIHSPRNIGMISDSLRKVGAARSIVIDEDDVILAGNGVVDAAAEAGIERVRVIEADGDEIIAVRRTGLTDEQKQILSYFDNRTAELASWDAQQIVADLDAGMDLSGMFYEEELRGILESAADALLLEQEPLEDPEPQIDKAEELREKWSVETGQMWKLGDHRIICGDCTDEAVVARVMQGERPLLMVTDPPYGVDYDPMWRQEALGAAVRRTGKMQNDDIADWRAAWRLFGGDVLYCWAGMLTTDQVLASIIESGFSIRAEIVWAKQWTPFGRGHYVPNHESCWYAVRKGVSASWIEQEIQQTVWDDIASDKTAEGGHGTQKPVECMARPMRHHAAPIIYDPFVGSGTTLVACEQLGRKCRAIEIEPKYVAVTLERWAEMTGKTPELIE